MAPKQAPGGRPHSGEGSVTHRRQPLKSQKSLSFLIGFAVGLSELLSRYDWSVKMILTSGPGWTYTAVNGFAAVIAYRATVDWNIPAGLIGKPEWWRVLLVSSIAMAALRSAFATVRIGEERVGIGLVSVVTVFLSRAERGLDQRLTRMRWKHVGSTLADLTYEATREYFLGVTLTALPSLTNSERETIQSETDKLQKLDVDADIKMRLLALYVAGKLGDELFLEIASTAKLRFAAELEAERNRRHKSLARLAELKDALRD